MKKILTVFVTMLIMMIANLASADMPDPYAEVRRAMETKYNDSKSLIKESMKFTALQSSNTMFIRFKLPEKNDYACEIYANELPLRYGSISYNPYKRYRGIPDPSNRFPSPSDKMIKKFEGHYDGVNDIAETFEYKTPEKKDSQKIPVSDYLLKIECRFTHKETAFGSKKLINPATETFWYKISVKQEDGKISVEVS